ncbi:hypothetical protein C8R44DRAFT_988369 [Mycena epipterygia]|nr:hypothetical protein C8R44DRAFT_988369 [Mycena epipterygia]
MRQQRVYAGSFGPDLSLLVRSYAPTALFYALSITPLSDPPPANPLLSIAMAEYSYRYALGPHLDDTTDSEADSPVIEPIEHPELEGEIAQIQDLEEEPEEESEEPPALEQDTPEGLEDALEALRLEVLEDIPPEDRLDSEM